MVLSFCPKLKATVPDLTQDFVFRGFVLEAAEKGDDDMARKNNIKYLLKTELNKMQAYGRSKFADQMKTKTERSKMKQAGVAFEQYRKIDFCKDYIYSKNTMQTYQNEIDKFAKYLSEQGLSKITLEEAEKRVQEYLDFLSNTKKLSACSIHTAAAALTKVFKTYLWDYTIPQRSVSKIERGNLTYMNSETDMISKLETNRVWRINRDYLGMRKRELISLKSKMIKEIDGRVEIHYIGKGGKHNRQIFIDSEEKKFILSLKEGKRDEDYIFNKAEVNLATNLHKARELRAKIVYKRICNDIIKRGQIAEKEYISYIEEVFGAAGKRLKENLHTPYITRGENRKRLENGCREISYNRIAVLFVSCTILQHFRSNVSVENYIGK